MGGGQERGREAGRGRVGRRMAASERERGREEGRGRAGVQTTAGERERGRKEGRGRETHSIVCHFYTSSRLGPSNGSLSFTSFQKNSKIHCESSDDIQPTRFVWASEKSQPVGLGKKGP